MHLPHLVLLAGILGAAAHPSGHAHQHAHRGLEGKRGGRPSFYKNVHHHPIPKPKESPKASSSSSSAAPAAATPSASNTPAAKGKGAYKSFCSSGVSSRKEKRVTTDQIFYAGNLGMDGGCPWNSNMIEISSDVIDQYDYVQKLTNRAKVSYEVRCGNKLGADKKVTGMFVVPGQKLLTFSLQPGETKSMAVQGDSQIICAFAPSSVPTTTFGQYAGNWVEADFGNASNKKWSGADCSSLVAQHYNMNVPGCRVCGHNTCSTIWPGGKGENAYTKGMEALDGIGLNIPPGKVVLEIDVGYGES